MPTAIVGRKNASTNLPDHPTSFGRKKQRKPDTTYAAAIAAIRKPLLYTTPTSSL
jgi:hypothetical protein